MRLRLTVGVDSVAQLLGEFFASQVSALSISRCRCVKGIAQNTENRRCPEITRQNCHRLLRKETHRPGSHHLECNLWTQVQIETS